MKSAFYSLASLLVLAACGGGEGKATPLDPAAYLTVETGALPIVLSAPHGGTLEVPGVPERTTGVTVLDTHTRELLEAVQTRLTALTSKKAHSVCGLASRKYVDFNRPAIGAYESPAAASLYQAYHTALLTAVHAARMRSPAAALLVDLHGQGVDETQVYRGTQNGQTADLNTLFATPKGFLSTLTGAGVSVAPSIPSGTENPNFNGGYIVITYGRGTAGGVNAVQLEFGSRYRNTQSDIEATAAKIADALVAHLQANGAL